MHGHDKFDLPKALKLRTQGLGNAVIAQRLNVTSGAIYAAFRKYDAEHGVMGNKQPRRRTVCWV